jgi:hypothetical protein
MQDSINLASQEFIFLDLVVLFSQIILQAADIECDTIIAS